MPEAVLKPTISYLKAKLQFSRSFLLCAHMSYVMVFLQLSMSASSQLALNLSLGRTLCYAYCVCVFVRACTHLPEVGNGGFSWTCSCYVLGLLGVRVHLVVKQTHTHTHMGH